MNLRFGHLFRLVFVLFFLYLMGDVFYRWDGFSYYSTFYEFLPGVALVSIIWSMMAVLSSVLIWLPIKVFEWLCKRIGWKIDAENMLIFLSCFVFVGAVSWVIKRYLIDIGLTFELKLIVMLAILLVTSCLTWFLRGKLIFLLERITPLVWLFTIIVILSMPLVAYNILIKDVDMDLKESIEIAKDKNSPNIILLTFDALTTKNMSLYGYKRETTPFINQWAKDASVFTNVKAADGYTTPTTASLMTGKRPWTHQTYHQRSAIPKGPTENIAQPLKESGYYTMAYAENKNASPVSLNIYNSFNEYKSFIPEDQDLLSRIQAWFYHLFFGKIKLYDWIFLEDFAPTNLFKKVIYYPLYYSRYKKSVWEEKKAVPVQVNTILDKFISDIDKNDYTEPFFVWLHMMPPHEPYLPPEPFMGTFDSSPRLRTLDEQFEYRSVVADHLRDSGQFTKEDLKLLDTYKARYDENILFCDDNFEKFINKLKERNKLDNTVVILSADHGEIFEKNSLGHGGILYEPVTNIPLIIKYPNQIKGLIFNDLIEQIDISATILDIANISLPLWLEGRSLLPLLSNQEFKLRPAFFMHLEANRRRGHQIEKGMFVVWEDDYKLMHDLGKKESLLFNLKRDPEEQYNLIDKEPEVGRRLLGLIKNNLKKANEEILNSR